MDEEREVDIIGIRIPAKDCWKRYFEQLRSRKKLLNMLK